MFYKTKLGVWKDRTGEVPQICNGSAGLKDLVPKVPRLCSESVRLEGLRAFFAVRQRSINVAGGYRVAQGT